MNHYNIYTDWNSIFGGAGEKSASVVHAKSNNDAETLELNHLEPWNGMVECLGSHDGWCHMQMGQNHN